MSRLAFTRAVRVEISKISEWFTTPQLLKRLPKAVREKNNRGDVSEFLLLLKCRGEVAFRPFSETSEWGSWKRTEIFKQVAGTKRRAKY